MIGMGMQFIASDVNISREAAVTYNLEMRTSAHDCFQ